MKTLLRTGLLLLVIIGCGCRTCGKKERMMEPGEQTGVVTLKGRPIVLLGDPVVVGQKAPGFKVVDATFEPVSFSSFNGKVWLISVVPSLDTRVCSIQTKRFNDEVATLPSNVVAMTISMDLPYAQKRFCETEKVARIPIYSDHVWREFGTRYGLIIKNMEVLARSVFVVDAAGTVTYRQIVPEFSHEPDYAAALEAVRRAATNQP